MISIFFWSRQTEQVWLFLPAHLDHSEVLCQGMIEHGIFSSLHVETLPTVYAVGSLVCCFYLPKNLNYGNQIGLCTTKTEPAPFFILEQL